MAGNSAFDCFPCFLSQLRLTTGGRWFSLLAMTRQGQVASRAFHLQTHLCVFFYHWRRHALHVGFDQISHVQQWEQVPRSLFLNSRFLAYWRWLTA